MVEIKLIEIKLMSTNVLALTRALSLAVAGDRRNKRVTQYA